MKKIAMNLKLILQNLQKTNTKDLKHLIVFFLATIAWTWAFFIPIAIFNLDWSSGIGLILFLAGGPAPSLMGIVMVFITFNPIQRQDYFNRCIEFQRVGWWLLFPIGFFTVLAIAGIAIDIAQGGALPGMAAMKTLAGNPLMIPVALFLYLWSGPLNEEFGWRGYALDPLLSNFGFVRGSVILGVVWGIWHLPWCFMPGQVQQLGTFWLYILSLIGLSLVISLIYVKTRRSILAAILMHFSSNFLMSQLLTPVSTQYETWRMVLLSAAGCVIAGYAIYKKEKILAGFMKDIKTCESLS